MTRRVIIPARSTRNVWVWQKSFRSGYNESTAAFVVIGTIEVYTNIFNLGPWHGGSTVFSSRTCHPAGVTSTSEANFCQNVSFATSVSHRDPQPLGRQVGHDTRRACKDPDALAPGPGRLEA